MSKDRRQAHRRNLAMGLGASALVHAAVLSFLTLPSPAPKPQPLQGPAVSPPEAALTVVRLTERPPDIELATSTAAASALPVHESPPHLDLAVRPVVARVAAAAPSSSPTITMAAVTPVERPAPRPVATEGSVEEGGRSGGGGRFGGVSLGGMFGGGSRGVDRCTPGLHDLLGRGRPDVVTAVNNRAPRPSIW